MPIPLPDWFAKMDYSTGFDPASIERRLIRNRFLVKTVILYHNTNGSPLELSNALGIARATLGGTYSSYQGVITPQLAVKLSRAGGRENGEYNFPRTLFRPDIFGE
jgi:hypothetical protein